jgi:proteasome assembly chaperone (PAC2) family protein
MIVGWKEDAGHLGSIVIEYLSNGINAEAFCEIEPVGFYSLGGVAVSRDVAQFPEAAFYYARRHDLVLYDGNEPGLEQYEHLSAIADFAEHHCRIKELYTVGGTVSAIAHTAPRRMWAVFSKKGLQEELRGYGLENMTWEGPPAIHSYLLWIAQRRDIPAVSVWSEVPFYIAGEDDLQGAKQTLSFIDKKFALDLDMSALNEQIVDQNARIDRCREEDPNVDRYVRMLESGAPPERDEQIELATKIAECLRNP